MFEDLLEPYFSDKFPPIKKGDIFSIEFNDSSVSPPSIRLIEFKVTELVVSDKSGSPGVSGVGIIGPNTEIVFDDEPLNRADEDYRFSDTGYSEIGGCNRQLEQIRELVELPLRHPELFVSLGIPPPKGVLLYGPPGSGKTSLAKAVAVETGAYFHVINGPEIMSKLAGESEAKLRQVKELVFDLKRVEP